MAVYKIEITNTIYVHAQNSATARYMAKHLVKPPVVDKDYGILNVKTETTIKEARLFTHYSI